MTPTLPISGCPSKAARYLRFPITTPPRKGSYLPRRSAVLLTICITLAMLFAPHHLLYGEVSLKNGNFFTSFTDFSYSGGLELKIERVYNSKSSFKGIFGWGWGMEYEVHITIEGDGSVVVHEYGGGADNVFRPSALDVQELQDAVNTMVISDKKLAPAPPNTNWTQYKDHLLKDADFRRQEWDRLVAAKAIPPRQLPVGTHLTSLQFSYQSLERISGGYRRTFDNGRVEDFNDSGELVHISDANSNWIELHYDKHGHLSDATDNLGNLLRFEIDEQGLVQSIEDHGGHTAIYKYNRLGELVYSRGPSGTENGYQYDLSNRHNLVGIAYSDATTMAISYYSRQQFENVWSVKDRDGTLSSYTYDIGSRSSSEPDSYTVSTRLLDPEDHPLSASSYRYYYKHNADGSQWTYRLVTTIDGEKTDTVYDQSSGQPTLVKTSSGATSIHYDAEGRISLKETQTGTSRFEYDNAFGKVSRVEQCEHSSPKDCKEFGFTYDPHTGNLTLATSKQSSRSGTTSVSLAYDEHGRVSTMTTSTRSITLAYNDKSKPVRIDVKGIGSLQIQYDADDTVSSVTSVGDNLSPKEKTEVAAEVTKAFQELLDIVSVAGVNLSL